MMGSMAWRRLSTGAAAEDDGYDGLRVCGHAALSVVSLGLSMSSNRHLSNHLLEHQQIVRCWFFTDLETPLPHKVQLHRFAGCFELSEGHGIQCESQGLTTAKPSIPSKSLVLRVTKVKLTAKAMAAICASAVSIGLPANWRCALTKAYAPRPSHQSRYNDP